MDISNVAEFARSVSENVSRVIVGKESAIKLVLCAMLARGHILLEDVPGTGKTVMAKSLARSLDAGFSRIQFTPDLLPTDVTGLSVWDAQAGKFTFKPGPVFTNILLGRRDQPRHAAHAVGAAGVHGGAAGDRGRRNAPAGGAVPGGGHAEPGRDTGHVPAARGAAGSLPGAAQAGLS